MAGTIKHEWNGTVLTITSDSGTSSADLKGEKGDDGARGPQGKACSVATDTTHLGGISAKEYALKTYVNAAAAAVNKLDNSYFPSAFVINQRGNTSYSGAIQYTIDRWKTSNANTTVETTEKGIKLTNTTSGSGGYLQQTLENPKTRLGKTYTLAAMLEDGTIVCNTATLPATFPSTITQYATLMVGNVSVGAIQVSTNSVWVRVWSNPNEDTRTFIWAALYEGAYTAETLPKYQYKGYAAEWNECRRYLKVYDLTQFPITITSAGYASVGIDYTNMRITPSIVYELAGLYYGTQRITSITQITVRTLPASELLVNIGNDAAAFQTGSIRFSKLTLNAEL